MKLPTLFFSFMLTVPLLGGTAASHETVNAANVSLEWHTDTNEFLQAEGDSVLTLSLTAQGRLLRSEECRCTLLLYPGEVSPRVRPTVLTLSPGVGSTLETLVTAPKAGFYSLVLDAKPVNVATFTPFRTVLKLQAVEDVFNPPPKSTGGK